MPPPFFGPSKKTNYEEINSNVSHDNSRGYESPSRKKHGKKGNAKNKGKEPKHHVAAYQEPRRERLTERDRWYLYAIESMKKKRFVGSKNGVKKLDDFDKEAMVKLLRPGMCHAGHQGAKAWCYIYWGAVYIPVIGYDLQGDGEVYANKGWEDLNKWTVVDTTSPDPNFGSEEMQRQVPANHFCFIPVILKLSEAMEWEVLTGIPASMTGGTEEHKIEFCARAIQMVCQRVGRVGKKCADKFFQNIPEIWMTVTDHGIELVPPVGGVQRLRHGD